MVATATVCPGKVRTCLQKVCRAACEHVVTASPEKYVFEGFCPFLPIFACFGAFWGRIWPFCPKMAKTPIEKRDFFGQKNFLIM